MANQERTYPFTWAGIPYAERPEGSPVYSLMPGQQRATRQLWIRWGSDDQAIPRAYKMFAGYTERKTHADGGVYLSRKIPHPLPNFFPLLYCEGFQSVNGSRPLSPGGGTGPTYDNVRTACYEEALVTASYWAPPYAVERDEQVYSPNGYPTEYKLQRYVSGNRRIIGKVQTIPAYGPLKWVSDGTAADTTMVYPLNEVDVTIVWHQIPLAAIPLTAIDNCYGRTNSATFGDETTIVGKYGLGTMVFGGAEPTFYRMSNGEWAADLAYRFRQYPNGANKFLRIKKDALPTWDSVAFDGTTNTKPLFASADYRTLFTPV